MTRRTEKAPPAAAIAAGAIASETIGYSQLPGAHLLVGPGPVPAGRSDPLRRRDGPAHRRIGRLAGGRLCLYGRPTITAGAFCMFRALYDWTMRLAGHRHAIRYMAAVSFAESSFFPIPPDVMLVPMVLARRDQAWLIATVCTIASVLGGIAGYAIGYFLYDSVGQWLMRIYGMADGIEQFRLWYAEWGAAIILVKGLTPIPFKLVTIASGFAAFNFPLFVLCALVTRGARYFLIAALLRRYGPPVQAFIDERAKLVGWGFLAVVVSGFGVVALL